MVSTIRNIIAHKITLKQIVGHKHIYSLNGFALPSTQKHLYKYMQLNRFVSSVKNNELVFVSPDTWKDPFERRFFKTDYTSLNFKRPEIGCMCLTSKSSTNEEASWRMYVNPNDKALRLSIDFNEFCKMLDNYAGTNDCKVYIGNVIYDFTKEEIMSLNNNTKNINYDTYFPSPLSLENYLTLMLIKRVSFAFENEVRIFIVKDNSLTDTNGLLKIPKINYTKSFIPKVMIAPYEPLPKEDITTPFRIKINKIESKEYKKIIGVLFGCAVEQSQLYSSCSPVKKV